MIALYPGAFKPPHRGHFEVVKSLLNGTHNGQVYTKDNYKDAGASSLSGKKSIVDKINKVIVFPGGGERNGITKGESIAIWKIYSKYLPSHTALNKPTLVTLHVVDSPSTSITEVSKDTT